MENLHASPVSDEIKSTWYKALHDIIPTKDRLTAINLTDTSACSACGRPDSLQHKITECGEGPVIWTWTKKLLAYILRVDHRQITQTWTIRPDFHHCPSPPETGCGPLDYGGPRSLSPANTTTYFSPGLCGLYAPGQVGVIPTRPQAPAYRQVFGRHRLAAILK